MDERGEGTDQAGAAANEASPPFPYDLRQREDGSRYYQRKPDHRRIAEEWLATQPDKQAALQALLRQAFGLRGLKV